MALTHIFIARHGQAEAHHPDRPGDDLARRLTDVGAAEVMSAFAALARAGVAPSSIWHSPAMRTTATASIAARALGSGELLALDALAPGGSPRAALEAVAERATGVALLVGHMPAVGELVGLLVGSGGVRLSFVPSAVACIGLRSVSPRPIGDLLWFAPPEMLMSMRDLP